MRLTFQRSPFHFIFPSLHAQEYCYCPIPRQDGQSSRIQCFSLFTKSKTTASDLSRDDHLINSINYIDCLFHQLLIPLQNT